MACTKLQGQKQKSKYKLVSSRRLWFQTNVLCKDIFNTPAWGKKSVKELVFKLYPASAGGLD